MFEVVTQVDCGTQSIEFLNADSSPLDTTLFSDTRGSPANSFNVFYTELLSAVGSYQITYRVTFDSYTQLSRVQSIPFKVEIMDPCDNPVSISFDGTPDDQEYTIS